METLKKFLEIGDFDEKNHTPIHGSNEKIFLEKVFRKKNRSKLELVETQRLIEKYNSINSCFERAEHFVNISYNALNIFDPSNEKTILQNLSFFSLERTF